MGSLSNHPLQSTAPFGQGVVVREGEMIGPYLVEQLMASTPVGVFHAATNTGTNQPCLLKLLPREVAQEDAFRKRLEMEAAFLWRLRHENIIRSLGFGEQGGRVYLALECLNGGSLPDWFEATAPTNGGVSPAEVKRIMGQVLSALGHVHQAGLVHRNLSPATLWVTQAGQVKLVDFYLARVNRGFVDAAGYHIDVVMGDPTFLSPEIREGREFDSRSDFWSIGITTYFLLTGLLPTGVAKWPSQFVAGLDPRWDDFIGTCLAEHPDKRYQTAEAALAALKELDPKISVWRKFVGSIG